MYEDYIQMFAKKGKGIRNLDTVCQNIGRELAQKKMPHANNEKRVTTNGRRNRTTKWRNNQNARRKVRYYQTSGQKHFLKYQRRTGHLLETKLYSRNHIKRFNTCGVSLVRYLGPFLKRTRELQQMNQKTRKLMTILENLLSRDDIGIICQEKEEEEEEEEDYPAMKTASIRW